MDTQEILPALSPEYALLVGMVHDADIRRGAVCALNPRLFINPDYRAAFVALGTVYTNQGLDCVELAALGRSRSLSLDLSLLLAEKPQSPETLRSYIGIIQNEGGRAALRATLEQTLHELTSEGKATASIADALHDELTVLRRACLPWGTTHPSTKDLVHRAIGAIESISERGLITGVACGYVDIDKMLGGFKQGLYVVAARPWINMTGLSLGMALNIALDGKKSVLYNTMGKSEDLLMLQALTQRANVCLSDITSGFLPERDFPKLTGSAGKLAESKFRIRALRSPAAFYHECARLKDSEGLSLAIVDRFQDWLTGPRNHQDMNAKEYALGCELKEIAGKLELPILVLSEVSGEKDRKVRAHRPFIGDIRNHAAFEYEARAILLMHHEFDEETYGGEADKITVYIDRNSDGPIGNVGLTYIRRSGRFESESSIASDEKIYTGE